MQDILNTIKEENEERIQKDNKKYNIKIKELKPIKGEETKNKMRSWYFDGLYFKKKFHKTIITMYSENETIGKTEGELEVHSPIFIKIFLLDDILTNDKQNFKTHKQRELTENQKK